MADKLSADGRWLWSDMWGKWVPVGWDEDDASAPESFDDQVPVEERDRYRE